MAESSGEDPVVIPAAEPSAAEETRGRKVVGAGLWATGSRLLPQFYSLVMSVVAARYLGPDGMGRQSLIAFAALFGTTATALGLPTALMRYAAERVGAGKAETLPPLVRAAWKVEAVAASIGAVVLIAIGLHGAEPRAAWLLAGLTCAFGVLQKVPASVLIGLQRWREASAVSIVMGAVAMVATIVVLAAGGGVTGMIAVGTASTLVILLWTTVRMRKRVRELTAAPRRDVGLHRDVWRWAAISSLGVPITLIVWFRSEFFFLAHYSSDKEIALYSIAFSAYTALVIVPQSLGNAIAPAFATLYGARETERIRQGFSRAMRLLLVVTLPVAGAALALGPETLRVVYGNDFAGTKYPLLILLVMLPVVPLLQVSMSLIIGLGRQWVPLGVGAVAAVANLAFDAFLIPRYDAVGAATANAIGQIVASVPMIAFAIHLAGGIRWEARALARTAAAAVCAGLAAALTVRELGGVGGVVTGVVVWGVVFALLARLLRILPRADAAWLEDVAGARLRRPMRFLFGTAPAAIHVGGAGDSRV
jgi:O-antigen/teichoic acid export membrane protein